MTSFTDIREQKVRNKHLRLIALTTLFLYAAAFLTLKMPSTMQFCSAATAAVIATTFFMMSLWRPGDAKLFVLYALLMPPTGQESLFILPCIPLFINTFLLGFVFFAPMLLVTAFHQRAALIKMVLTIKKPRQVAYSFMTTLSIAWAIPSVYGHINAIMHWPAHPLTRYLLFFLLWKIAARLERYPLITRPLMVICFGLGLYTASGFYSLENISRIVFMILVYSLAFQSLKDLINSINDLKARVPFAPFLFAGCLASYTPFLNWMMSLLHR